jgi:hypothetical protein
MMFSKRFSVKFAETRELRRTLNPLEYSTVFKNLKTDAILNKNDYIFQSKCYKICAGK